MSLAFDWLHSNVAKASFVLFTHRGGGRGQSSSVLTKTSAGFLLDESLCPSNAAEELLPQSHTMATGTEGRYLVVLVEVVGLVVPGLAVLMVA